MKKIKLGNIHYLFDRMTGKPKTELTTEYACQNCRHLIEAEDIYCWQCGEKLEVSDIVEHHSQGKQLTEEEFQKERKLNAKK